MKVYCLAVALLALVVAVSAVNKEWEAYKALMKNYQTDEKLGQQWTRHMRKFFLANLPRIMSGERENPMFSCPGDKSPQVPTSVNKLLPGDIKVIGALGDSITAGFGILAVTPIDVIINDRGHSFSVGGQGSYDGGIITIPNILKKYNSELYGYSTDAGFVDSPEAMFNVAIGGSQAPDLPEQAEMIIQRMRDDNLVNMQNDWKMVTLLIGGNDLCRVCDYEDELNSRAFLENMERTLDMLAAGLPRTLVNVIPIMDVTPLPAISADGVCDTIQAIVCPCATETRYHELLKKYHTEYSSYTASLINSGKYDKDDFTVVFQPFLRDAQPPKNSKGQNDLSYFAPDCFHFSERGHQALTRSLWNALFDPVGRKATSMTFKEEIKCPAKGTFIATNKNSQTAILKADAPSDTVPDVMAVRAPGATSSGGVRSWAVGVAVVGSVCGVLALLAVVLVVVAMRRRKVEPNLS